MHNTLGDIKEHEGWVGVFTTNQDPHAKFKNGTRVCKTGTVGSDAHPDGSLATVLGSVGADDARFLVYFVEWDDMPKHACVVAHFRLKAA